MRVGLNALFLIPGDCGGLETFARELIEALVALNSATEYVVFVSLDAKDIFAPLQGKIEIAVCPFHARSRIARYCWEQLLLPWQIIAYRIDVLHSLGYVGPIFSPVPTVVTIHDANSKVVYATMTRIRRTVLWHVSSLAAKTADLVATVSEFSRGELAQWYGLGLENISVIPSGPGAHPDDRRCVSTPELEKLVSEGPYIAAIGGGYPHKNMARLIEAYQKIADRIQHRLIIIGYISGAPLDCKMPDTIVCTGYVPRSDLQEVLRRCDLFVMPSLYEGFGFPVLEAQALGAPVACSRRAALIELMNDSAALFNPEDVDDIAAVMSQCIRDRTLNSELRRMSLDNVTRFSWTKSAQEYERAYKVFGRTLNSWLYHSFRCILRLT
jgi:glycosyltransferase involved in cell wall biosynthesis